MNLKLLLERFVTKIKTILDKYVEYSKKMHPDISIEFITKVHKFMFQECHLDKLNEEYLYEFPKRAEHNKYSAKKHPNIPIEKIDAINKYMDNPAKRKSGWDHAKVRHNPETIAKTLSGDGGKDKRRKAYKDALAVAKDHVRLDNKRNKVKPRDLNK